jgi:cell division septum initiation protein DivIVA
MSDTGSQNSSDSPGVDDLREQIEQTRDDLALTVEALTAKADVKGRAKEKAAEVTAQAKHRAAAVTTQAKDKAALVTAQAKQGAAHSTQVAREKSVLAREKMPTTVRDQPVILLAAAGVVLLTVLGWLVRRHRS